MVTFCSSPEPTEDSAPHPPLPFLWRGGVSHNFPHLPEDGTWDGNTLSTEAEVNPLCLSPSQGLQLSHGTHVGVFLPPFQPDSRAEDRATLGYLAGPGSRPVSIPTLVMCSCTENTAGSCCQPNPNPSVRSSGTMLPRTRVPLRKCNGVVRLPHALTTARTACSSDTDHSFVLGIVLDSCNGSEHASAAGFMNAEGAATCYPLHPQQGCSAAKDQLTELTFPPGTVPQVTGGVPALCSTHTLDQTLGVSQPVPSSRPQQ